jgi:hypothetical protein
MKQIRKFFGCKPRVGDEISAGMDYGVHFTGVVFRDQSNHRDMPGYFCKGTFHISNMWKGEVVEHVEETFIPLAKASLL